MIPNFVSEMRAALGPSHLLWLPGVRAVVIDTAGKVLLHRSVETGEWTLISGIVEPGEHPEMAILREVREETSIEARIEALLGVTVSQQITHRNGDRAQYLEINYLCNIADGTPRVNDDESLEVSWFALSDLPEISSGDFTTIRHGLSSARSRLPS